MHRVGGRPPGRYLVRLVYPVTAAEVEAVRAVLLAADRPLVVLRLLVVTTDPLVLRQALDDDRVREHVREPFEQFGAIFREFAAAVAPAIEAARLAFEQLGRAAREAGMVPEQPPTDPRARALWLRQHRSVGPGGEPAGRRRRPRELEAGS